MIKDGKHTEENGDQRWYQNGKLHREDGPAVIRTCGSEYWYRRGQQHRDGGPAVKYVDGDMFWLQDGRLHRDDGPAVKYESGDESWWLHGKHLSSSEITTLKDSLEFDEMIREMCCAE